jgi:mRNA-degrading endonuclease toxin of MazEF toxin-antitoxin module
VSPEAFVTKVPAVLPITRIENSGRTPGFAVTLESAGTKTTGIVRCDQPRVLDLGARGGKKVESVPDAIMDDVLARLAPIFE